MYCTNESESKIFRMLAITCANWSSISNKVWTLLYHIFAVDTSPNTRHIHIVYEQWGHYTKTKVIFNIKHINWVMLLLDAMPLFYWGSRGRYIWRHDSFLKWQQIFWQGFGWNWILICPVLFLSLHQNGRRSNTAIVYRRAIMLLKLTVEFETFCRTLNGNEQIQFPCLKVKDIE